ncbi:spin [Symbiodinium sp. CCMP2592]|nr:spin [Symbiodinium sp. CCMP2592]
MLESTISGVGSIEVSSRDTQSWIRLSKREIGQPAALQTLYPGAAGYSIELAASKLGPGFPGFQAYHTSVKVDDLEYSFSGDGIVIGRGLPSHVRMADKPQVLYMGLTRISGEDLKEQLGRFFKRGTYDLLRKNCNSFTDCALFFLLDSRLDPGYRGLEQLGHMADRQAGIVQAITEGGYRPNPNADKFSVEFTISEIDKIKSSSAFGLR